MCSLYIYLFYLFTQDNRDVFMLDDLFLFLIHRTVKWPLSENSCVLNQLGELKTIVKTDRMSISRTS